MLKIMALLINFGGRRRRRRMCIERTSIRLVRMSMMMIHSLLAVPVPTTPIVRKRMIE
jgi:hypothetical protein